jgi:all-trans-nonaprenyl-diphosphate synthase
MPEDNAQSGSLLSIFKIFAMTSSAFSTSLHKSAFDLTEIVEPIRSDLEVVEEWLDTNLVDDNPFITELLSQIFRSGGKRIRPTLVLLCSRATLKAGSEFSRLHIILAVLTELIHSASLVHDDVIDGAALRRGNETVNRRWNDRMAVLMGDLLFAQASICLARIMNPVIVGIYGQVLGDLCAGEIRQMKQQFSIQVDWENYFRKSTSKTASLFAAGSHSGAILNNANDQTVESLRDYGLHLGLCFQIIDDLLDVIGERSILGKDPGSDLRGGLVTAPALFILEAGGKPAQRLVSLIQSRDVTSESGSLEALTLIKEHGGVEQTLRLARNYAERTKQALSTLAETPYKDALLLLVEYVLARVS